MNEVVKGEVHPNEEAEATKNESGDQYNSMGDTTETIERSVNMTHDPVLTKAEETEMSLSENYGSSSTAQLAEAQVLDEPDFQTQICTDPLAEAMNMTKMEIPQPLSEKETETATRETETAMRETETAMRETETAMRETETAMRETETAMRETERVVTKGEPETETPLVGGGEEDVAMGERRRERREEDGNREREKATKHTSKELLIWGAMSCPMNQLMSSYETNPFEFVPSRFLSLLPHPLSPLVEGAVMTCLEAIDLFGNAEKLIASVPAPLINRTTLPPALKTNTPTSRRLWSDEVLDSFTYAQKLSHATMLQACDKSSAVSVNKVLHVFPDNQLINNQYAAASASENMAIEAHSFMVVSSNTQHCCLYQRANPPPDGPKLAKNDLYGIPQEMVTVQITASQAPKRWLCLRRSAEERSKAFVVEIGGKRVAIQRDRGLSAEHNSALHLKVRKTG